MLGERGWSGRKERFRFGKGVDDESLRVVSTVSVILDEGTLTYDASD